MTRPTHSRCGTELTKQSGLWWCPTCKEQPVYVNAIDDPGDRPPVDYHLGGTLQRTKVGSDYDDDEGAADLPDYALDDLTEPEDD